MKADTILQTIGNTPHVRINRLFGSNLNAATPAAPSRTALHWPWWKMPKEAVP